MNLINLAVMILLCIGAAVLAEGEINKWNTRDVPLRRQKINGSVAKREADDSQTTGTDISNLNNNEMKIEEDYRNDNDRMINDESYNSSFPDDVSANSEDPNRTANDAISDDHTSKTGDSNNEISMTQPNVSNNEDTSEKLEDSNTQDKSIISNTPVDQNIMDIINEATDSETVRQNVTGFVIETTDDLLNDKNVKTTLAILKDNPGLIDNETKAVLTTVQLASNLPPELRKTALRHQTEIFLNTLNITELPNIIKSNATSPIPKINGTVFRTAVGNVPDFVAKHFNRSKTKDKTKDADYNPTVLLQRSQASWKHVSEAETDNSTEVVQACKFSNKFATCSIEYSAWNSKLWLNMTTNPDNQGVNVTIYERGTTPRITFTNRVNGTECHRFENGTFHQICLKVYGYQTELGPTRVCMQIGAALFNKGAASADFGCFSYSSNVRHEDPTGGEEPNPDILNRYILSNNYKNFMAQETSRSSHQSISILQIFVFTAITLYLSKY